MAGLVATALADTVTPRSDLTEDARSSAASELAESVLGPLLAMGFSWEDVQRASQAPQVLSVPRSQQGSDELISRILEVLAANERELELLQQVSDAGSSARAPGLAIIPQAPPAPLSHPSSAAAASEMDLDQLLALISTLPTELQAVAEEAQMKGASLKSAVTELLRIVDFDRRCIITEQERKEATYLVKDGLPRCVALVLDTAMARRNRQVSLTCPVCFDEIADGNAFRLECGHIFCADCMRGHCSAVAFPNCPHLSCEHRLTEQEVGRAGGAERLQAFREMQLQQAVEQLVGRVECPNPQCRSVVLCEPGERQCVACSCGWPPFCSACRQLYHGQRDCNEVGALRELWASWVTAGREQYHGRVEAAAQAIEQLNSVEESLRRQRELEADEAYKAEHCRCCPRCGRVVQKLDGCDHMKCGENYHGGDRQDGCGATFSWNQAQRYQPRVERRAAPRLDIDRVRVEGKDTRHFMVSCDACQAKHIRGPRFLCVHCPNFNLCAGCDFRGIARHPNEHVFEIIFTPQHMLNLDLPIGTEVELIGLVKDFALNGARAVVRRFHPTRGAYDLQLREPIPVPGDVQSVGSGGPQSELNLVPGTTYSEVLGVPARFVQMCADSDVAVASAMEAVDVQPRARRVHWSALPVGQQVQVSGSVRWLAQVPTLGQGAAAAQGQQGHVGMLDQQLGFVVGPCIAATDRFTIRVASSGQSCTTESANVKPLVSSQEDLAGLVQFQHAAQAARSLRLDLPVGQRVEFSGWVNGTSHEGVVATVAEPYDARHQSYTLHLETGGAETLSPEEAAKARMAEQYGVDDLVSMGADQLILLWDNFGIPRRDDASADTLLEEAMGFLPASRREPLCVPAHLVQPVIGNVIELQLLQERQALALSRAAGADQPPVAHPVREVAAPAVAREDEELQIALALSRGADAEGDGDEQLQRALALSRGASPVGSAEDEQLQRALALSRSTSPVGAAENSLAVAGPQSAAASAREEPQAEPAEVGDGSSVVSEEPCKCAKCGDVIRGVRVERGDQKYHFGCAP